MGAERGKTIWITWEKQLRNRSLAAALDVPLYEILSSRGRLTRYISCVARTAKVLWRERPSIVICQNPSLVLTLFLLGLRRPFGFKLVIDAHFGGVEAYNGSRTFQKVLDYCNRSADLVIVTNDAHARQIQLLGGKTFVSPDPLPDLSKYLGQAEEIPGKVFFICSFDIDEPFRQVFRAAEILLSDGFHFFASGNYYKGGIARDDFPHVHLLGFLPESEFYRHLLSSQVVVDLTDHENCLVCGAYEAMEAGKPLVLSRKKALQAYFTGGTVFTENRAEEIAAAVKKAHANQAELKEACLHWVLKEREGMKQRMVFLHHCLEEL